MYAVERLGSYITRGVYTVSGPFHPFGGAVDMIVVEQQDGSFKSSPWYVRFGKFQGVLKAKEKVVNISVNGVEADFHMYLDHKGEAYFLKEVDVEEEAESLLYPSSSGEETDGQSGERRPVKTKSRDCDAREELDSGGRVDASNGKILARTGSRRSRLLGLVFGRKSMKENNLWEEEGGPGVVRALERAEIAADLLEVQWCTNLATKRPGKDKVSQLSAADSRDGEADKSLQITGGESQLGSTVQDSTEKNPDQPLQRDLTGDFEGVQGNDCEQGSEKLDDSVEETSAQVSCKSTPNTAFETSSGGKLMEEQCEAISVLSRLNSQTSDGDSDHYEHAKDAISQITSSDLHPSGSTELGVCPNMQLDGEEVRIDREALSCNGVSVETEVDIVQSFAYCETLDCSRSELHGFDEQTQETVCISQGECREVHAHAEVLLETAEILSGVNSSTVSDLCVANETCNNLEYLRDGDNERILESEVTSKHFIASDSVETEVLEVNHQDVVIEGNAKDVNVETKVVEVPEEPSQRTNSCTFCMLDYSDVEDKEPPILTESCTPTVSDNLIPGSVQKTESCRIGTLFSFSNMVHQIQDENDIRNENDVCEVQLSEGLDASPCESSEEEQFLFSDVDDLKVSEVQFAESISWDGGENVNHPLLPVEVSGAENESGNRNHESDSYSEKSVHENLPNDTEELVEKSRKLSSPIEVPGCHMVAGERALRLVESLPNLRSHIDELEANNLCHSSQSLDLDTKSLRWALDRNYAPSCIKSDTDEKNQLAEGLMTTQDFLISGELNKVPFNSAIEVSLCKHLLYEGMGADAASKAFDAEKLDVDKFSSLGPAIIKNDRLVVRSNGHYFPWEVAAPIVLGMVSFGSEYIFKPKGMIPVDRVQKNHEGDPSNAIIASGGSWRIWPFSFKRSRTMKGVSPGLNGRRSSDVENSPDSTYNTGGNRIAPKAKDSKKKVRAITPTTEQLASLNLKEGRNTVTFTFSTAMLGKQEIDARIYVWKWNTRIVISDVDGTITKSDVLGQFMPLVGMDWSHIGVAHLFSAIKENGYQLLFLSARAIVQAYHTRQFLFNLKQDGKALPDGPVLISPNGLFPSLYREVIRRAPHEFKIACLEDIRALFPPDCNPFYAGFGNRDTDEISYLKVGIPKGKIFIINPKGEVAVNRRNDTKSYTSLHTLVNGMFPPMSSTEQEDFNSWNYWKLPPPVIDF